MSMERRDRESAILDLTYSLERAAQFGPTQAQKVLSLLEVVLLSKDEEVRYGTVQTLTKLPRLAPTQAEKVQSIFKELLNDKDARIRKEAAKEISGQSIPLSRPLLDLSRDTERGSPWIQEQGRDTIPFIRLSNKERIFIAPLAGAKVLEGCSMSLSSSFSS